MPISDIQQRDSEIRALNADIRKEETPKIHDIRKHLEKLGKGEQRKSSIS